MEVGQPSVGFPSAADDWPDILALYTVTFPLSATGESTCYRSIA